MEKLTGELPHLTERFNIGPGQENPILRLRNGGPELVSARWGLRCGWKGAASTSGGPINARSEGALSNGIFRRAVRSRRCLIPADGFYEWKKEVGQKQPYFIAREGDQPFFFAGLWEPGADARETYCILTTRPNCRVAELHDRMPVVLPSDALAEWLSVEELSADRFAELCASAADPDWLAYPVSSFVNSIRREGPECLVRDSGVQMELL